ncbi:MAG: serine acetyltransferase [Polyangiales bacterium]
MQQTSNTSDATKSGSPEAPPKTLKEIRSERRPGAEGSWKAFRQDVERHGGEYRNSAIWHMALYRFGNWSLARKNRQLRWLTSKMYGAVTPLMEILTGVRMDRMTRIGEGFHIVHTDAPISIHPEAIIGDRVGVMHGVTIGTNTGEGVPQIGNDVFIGTGAVVLGDITIGDNVSIAANSLVTTNVPPNSVAVGVPAKIYPKLKLR